MDTITAIYTWLTENYDAVLVVIAALHGLAVAVVNLTQTPKDDAIVERIYGFVEKLAGLFTTKAKQ